MPHRSCFLSLPASWYHLSPRLGFLPTRLPIAPPYLPFSAEQDKPPLSAHYRYPSSLSLHLVHQEQCSTLSYCVESVPHHRGRTKTSSANTSTSGAPVACSLFFCTASGHHHDHHHHHRDIFSRFRSFSWGKTIRMVNGTRNGSAEPNERTSLLNPGARVNGGEGVWTFAALYIKDERIWVRWPMQTIHLTYATLVRNYVNALLVFVPLGILSGALHWNPTTVFLLNFLAIIPLASLLSFATEELAAKMGQTLGGLMNATFGNAVELIVCLNASYFVPNL